MRQALAARSNLIRSAMRAARGSDGSYQIGRTDERQVLFNQGHSPPESSIVPRFTGLTILI
jgi:hypothetical protein